MWTQFFEAQVYPSKENAVYQDNKRNITLETKGKPASSKRIQHVKVKYLFIKDKIDSDEINVKYCTTHEMSADLLTKLLQGNKLHLMWAWLMNYTVNHHENTQQLQG